MGQIVGYEASFSADFVLAQLIQPQVCRCNYHSISTFCCRSKRCSSYPSSNSVHIEDRKTYRFVKGPVVAIAKITLAIATF